MSRITTHVLDTALGRPAAGVGIRLEARVGNEWRMVGSGQTDDDGRLKTLAPDGLAAGTYRMGFDVGTYHAARGVVGFYPEVSVVFVVRDAAEHHHVPLLLSPFGFSTYRGS